MSQIEIWPRQIGRIISSKAQLLVVEAKFIFWMDNPEIENIEEVFYSEKKSVCQDCTMKLSYLWHDAGKQTLEHMTCIIASSWEKDNT